jgi:hypothetical protein
MDQNRALLFSDWNIEALITNMNSDREGDFAQLVTMVQHGRYEEASDWLKVEISHYPWILLINAFVNIKNGNTDEARRLLRAVTLISKDTLVQLWAWHNLRQLGRMPSAALAQQVLGMIIEVPYENGAEILASYADGTARYINHSGAMILWEDFDETITPLIYEGLKMAHPVGDPIERHIDRPISEGNIRLTILMPGGMSVWEGSPEDGSAVSRLFAQQANLLRALVRLALDKREKDS